MEQAGLRSFANEAMARAAQDAAFRAALVADPVQTLEQTFGVDIPRGTATEGFRSRVRWRFGLEPLDDELSEEQLEAVAGGACTCVPCSLGPTPV
jgi:hypothetical protein